MNKIVSWLSYHKEFVGTTVVVLSSIAFFVSFPQSKTLSPVLQGFIASFGIFLAVPILYCKIILRRPLSTLGFRKGNPWAGVGGSVLALVVALAALFVLWNFTPLLKNYRLPVAVEEQFLFFVLYEVVLNGIIVFMFEVYFRGLIMMLWLRSWGVWSVGVQTIIFTFFLFAGGDVNASTIPYLLFAPFSGLIVYQSGSLWYGLGASWFFFLLTDALILIFR